MAKERKLTWNQKDYYTNYYPGKGCRCDARNEGECGCSKIDWTTIETIALRTQAQKLSWQPIETAPLDGTTVDLYYKDGGRETDCSYMEAMNGKKCWHSWGYTEQYGMRWYVIPYSGQPLAWKLIEEYVHEIY